MLCHYQVVSQHVQGSVFTDHFTIRTKTKTNFEPSKNPGLVSDPVIFFWSIWKRAKHDGDLPLTLKDSW